MSKQKQKTGIFRSFWTKIENIESAQEAASHGAIATGYFALSKASCFFSSV